MNKFTASLLTATLASANPFEGKNLYVNPSYKEELEGSIKTAEGNVKSVLESMRNIPSAYWLDVKAKQIDSSVNVLPYRTIYNHLF